jgi:hypothetical protein
MHPLVPPVLLRMPRLFGSSGDDEGSGIGLDGDGNTYTDGWTGSSDFPTTRRAFQTVYGAEGQEQRLQVRACRIFVAVVQDFDDPFSPSRRRSAPRCRDTAAQHAGKPQPRCHRLLGTNSHPQP